MTVGPAALESAPALSRPVIRDHQQNVLPGFAECGGRSGEMFRLLDSGLAVFEQDGARAAELAPGDGHRRSGRLGHSRNQLGVVGDPHGEAERTSH